MNILRKMGLTSHKKSSTQPLYTRYVFRKTRDGEIIDNVSHRYIGVDSKNVINNIDMYRLTVFRMGFFGAAHVLGGGGGKPSPLNLSRISYNEKTWHSYTLPKEDPKSIWITWHTSWVPLILAFFHQKSAKFAISRNADIDCIVIHNFYLF